MLIQYKEDNKITYANVVMIIIQGIITLEKVSCDRSLSMIKRNNCHEGL